MDGMIMVMDMLCFVWSTLHSSGVCSFLYMFMYTYYLNTRYHCQSLILDECRNVNCHSSTGMFANGAFQLSS